MKTTILTFPPVSRDHPGVGPILFQIVHLILAVNYFIFVILLMFVPQRHGYGGGITVSLPSFLILFSVLVTLHLVLILRHRIPGKIVHYGGISLVIMSAMTLSLILFSRQSANLIQAAYPIPLLIYVSLGISLLAGVYCTQRDLISGHQEQKTIIHEIKTGFPLPENRYTHTRILAEGGVGTIWYAERIIDGFPVVVKVPLHDDEQTGMSFLQEISIWKELNHPNIVSVLSVNVLPVPYIEMEYHPGSLATLDKPVPVTRALQIMSGLVSALIYAHDRSIVHCDIKPTNILLTGDGVPKLTDWGLSRSVPSRWTVPGFSPRYAAPEQSLSIPECSPATDIWQTGMVFSELLTGNAKIPSGDEPVFLQPGGVAILPIILRCLASDPMNRYPSAKALREDLDRCYNTYHRERLKKQPEDLKKE
jgi:hypothetical protein